ncbi:MAG: 50S ribosomal protein L11 methyltransferase [Ectothiorhodospiraceae bacterium]|nr:50S ribosomal protein L11 methyltransferase [Chromatiales bacterium]MCP5157015.1 50S ribosomal protein L11 methyltransferase [Ectothiorhodospiraceae bacterium]
MAEPAASPWLHVSVVCSASEVALAECALEEAGALGVTLTDAGDDPLYEPPPGATPLWQATRVTGLFDLALDTEACLAAIQLAMPGRVARIEPLAERDWTRAWLDRFGPMRFGERLWVIPTEHPVPADAEVALRLDPGLAFGTGTHPTTAMCLRWLDGLDLRDRGVLDYGCGSGILAIAATLLGAHRADAIDIDRQALLATAENAGRNGVGARVHPTLPRPLPDAGYDVVVANILAGPLATLAPTLGPTLAPGARLALAGLLAAQADAVIAAYRPWCTLDVRARDAEWVLLATH